MALSRRRRACFRANVARVVCAHPKREEMAPCATSSISPTNQFPVTRNVSPPGRCCPCPDDWKKQSRVVPHSASSLVRMVPRHEVVVVREQPFHPNLGLLRVVSFRVMNCGAVVGNPVWPCCPAFHEPSPAPANRAVTVAKLMLANAKVKDFTITNHCIWRALIRPRKTSKMNC